jgi:hypothetical protein
MKLNKFYLAVFVLLLFQTIASAGDNFIIIANKNDSCFHHWRLGSSTKIRSTEELSEFINLYFNGKEIPIETFFSAELLNYWIAQNIRRGFCSEKAREDINQSLIQITNIDTIYHEKELYEMFSGMASKQLYNDLKLTVNTAKKTKEKRRLEKAILVVKRKLAASKAKAN